jgi:hypothetical protein
MITCHISVISVIILGGKIEVEIRNLNVQLQKMLIPSPPQSHPQS